MSRLPGISRLAPLFFLHAGVLPVPSAHAQAVVVSPNCGTNATHFLLSAAGVPICYCAPAPCDNGYSLFVDGQPVLSTVFIDPCLPSFSIDMQKLITDPGSRPASIQ